MRWLGRRQFRRTTLWLVFCVSLLSGIGLAHSGQVVNPLPVWLAGIALLVKLRSRSCATLLVVVAGGLLFGWWRGDGYMAKLAQYQTLYGQKITLTGQALDDGVYGKNSQISFDASRIQLPDGERLAGDIEISGFGPAAIFQGDVVQVSGKLYPGLAQYQAFVSFAAIQVVEHQASPVADIRRKFTAGMQTALPEPLAPFAMGLLIGQRATLPPDIKQDLLMVGLTHIIAVSGYNLTIMLQASRRIFGNRSKRISTGLSLGLIAVFLLLAGSSASIVRAAIVSVLSIWARYYGRAFRPQLLIALAAAITAWAHPFYLWSDPSWYLSFLAFYGVLVVAPLVQSRWKSRWRDSLVGSVAVECVCAELMTLPFILFAFGQVSLVGLPANVLVVTLVPLAMLLSMMAGLAGMLVGSVAGWISWPATLLLTYMLDTARLLARLPGVFRQQLAFSTKQMVALYTLIVITTMLLGFKIRQRNGMITDIDHPKL